MIPIFDFIQRGTSPSEYLKQWMDVMEKSGRPVMMVEDIDRDNPNGSMLYEALEKVSLSSGIPMEKLCFWPTSLAHADTPTIDNPNAITVTMTMNFEAFDVEALPTKQDDSGKPV